MLKKNYHRIRGQSISRRLNGMFAILIVAIICLYFVISITRKIIVFYNDGVTFDIEFADAYSRDVQLVIDIEGESGYECNSTESIPERIYITHKYDICDDMIPSHLQYKISQNDTNYFFVRDNIQRIKKFNPEFQVICFDDHRAYNYIKSNAPIFAEYFKNETKGMYKADLFRLIVLYNEGGYYFDSDMEPMMPLNQFINKEATFTTVINAGKRNIFQSYLGSIKCNPILKMNLNVFYEYYSNKRRFPINCGTVFMGNALRIYTDQSSLKEIQKQSRFHNQTIHLLQEQLYNGTDSEQILSARHDSRHYQWAIYDHLTNLYPFWSRISGYRNSFMS